MTSVTLIDPGPISSPRLSICIATRNRAHIIGETLQSIIDQAGDDVEIVIVDGASTDNTREVVERFRQTFAQITYERLESNGGVDADYDRTIRCARGAYCWFMSDDDIILPGAIDAVLHRTAERPDVLVVNAESRSRDLSIVLARRRLDVDHDEEFSPIDSAEFFLKTARFLTFIGCLIVRRAFWLSRDASRYFGSMFAHEGVLYANALSQPAVIDATPRVAIRHGNVSWGSHAFEIWLFRWPKLIWSLNQLPEGARLRVTPREPWRNLKALLAWRIRGAYSLREYQQFLAQRDAPFLFRILARTIAVVPRLVLIIPAVVFLTLVQRDSRIALYELLDSTLDRWPRISAWAVRRLV